jgi:hypothetical protein
MNTQRYRQKALSQADLPTKKETKMKGEGKKQTLQFACIIGLAMFAGGVMADPGDDKNKNTIEGTWLAVTTIPNPPPGVQSPFFSLQTFTGTGEAIEANSTTQDRTVAEGEWLRTGEHKFVRVMTYFVFGSGHVFMDFTRVTSVIELAPDGETYTGTSQFQIYAPNGVQLASGQSTFVAHRCGIGDDVPSCIPS